jgi:hypothetical protein
MALVLATKYHSALWLTLWKERPVWYSEQNTGLARTATLLSITL